METVTVSPKKQIVIPSQMLRTFGVKPGQKFVVMEYNNRIELVPIEPIQNLRGKFKGIDTTIEREPDRI